MQYLNIFVKIHNMIRFWSYIFLSNPHSIQSKIIDLAFTLRSKMWRVIFLYFLKISNLTKLKKYKIKILARIGKFGFIYFLKCLLSSIFLFLYYLNPLFFLNSIKLLVIWLIVVYFIGTAENVGFTVSEKSVCHWMGVVG